MAKRREEQAVRAKQLELCRADMSFSKTNIARENGLAFVLGQGRRTILLFCLEARRVASFCLDFFVTFFIKQESSNINLNNTCNLLTSQK